MYGGHITDDWDRRTNNTYLEVLLQPAIMQQMQLTLHPGFKSPDPAKFEREQYVNYIEEKLPVEQPQMFGLHPNAEIGFRTDQSEQLCLSILDLGSGDEVGGEEGASKQTVAESALQDILENHRDAIFDIDAVLSLLDEPGPYHTVFLQECELMNALIETMLATLEELDLGFKGELTMGDHIGGKCTQERVKNCQTYTLSGINFNWPSKS